MIGEEVKDGSIIMHVETKHLRLLTSLQSLGVQVVNFISGGLPFLSVIVLLEKFYLGKGLGSTGINCPLSFSFMLAIPD